MLQAILALSDKTFWLPRGGSTVSGELDSLFNVIMWICVFFFLLVTVLLVWFVLRYRHRPGVTRDPAAGHSTALEITWTLIPSVICVFLYYYGFREYMNMAIEPPNSYEITATGQMWQWSFTYPNGYTDPQLHVPVNTPVRVVLQSQDVIHSLYLPLMRVKKDVVPGRFNRLWFEATSANGAAYLTNVTIDGKPTEIGVDVGGVRLAPTQDKFGSLPADVQAVLASKSPTPTTRPAADKMVEGFSLLNGSTLYVIETNGTPGVIDGAGATGRQMIPFGSLPAEVRSALEEEAKGANIPANQPVQAYDDAEPSDIYCAAYCGTNHSMMRSRVIVHRTQADFDKWLAGAAAKAMNLPPVELGKKLYMTKGCAQCHTIDGSKLVGPSWKDMWGRMEKMSDGKEVLVDEPYVIESIRSPLAKIVEGFPPQMPPFPPDMVKDNEVKGLIAFMKSISSHTSAADRAGPTSAPATRPAGAAPTTQK